MMKVFAAKYVELDNIMASVLKELNVSTASNYYLDYHGIESGVFRGVPSKGTVNVTVTGKANDVLIPISSTFSTEKGINYLTIQAGILPNIIQITKGAANGVDNIPPPFSGVTSIQWINETPTQSGTAYAEDVDWEFDGDQVNWNPGGAEPAEDSVYYVGLDPTENVSVTIPCIAERYGEQDVVDTGQITLNTDGITNVVSVINNEASIGATEQESDPSYRRRQLSTSRVQFGYSRIQSLVEEVEGVRSARAYQVTGVDVAYPNADWQESATWTTFETWNFYSTGDVDVAQTWKPTGDRIGIKEISLYVQKVNTGGEPPPLRMELYLWVDDYATTVSKLLLSFGLFSPEDVDADDPTGWQEIKISQKFGGLDYTKTYLLLVKTAESGSTSDSHWNLKYQNSGNEYADGKMYADGVERNSGLADIAFKTRWGGAAFNVIVAMVQGYDFNNYVDIVWSRIFDFKRRAFVPICIQANIMEAEVKNINVTATLFVTSQSDYAAVSSECREALANYINNLIPGENVVFSQIEKAMLNVEGIIKVRSVTIQKESETPITNAQEKDILIGELNIAEIGTTTFTEGK